MAVALRYVLVQVNARVSWDFTFRSQMAGRKNTGLREPWDPNGRAPRGLRPRCGARTRKNTGCLRQALASRADMLIIRGVNVFPTQIEVALAAEALFAPHYDKYQLVSANAHRVGCSLSRCSR